MTSLYTCVKHMRNGSKCRNPLSTYAAERVWALENGTHFSWYAKNVQGVPLGIVTVFSRFWLLKELGNVLKSATWTPCRIISKGIWKWLTSLQRTVYWKQWIAPLPLRGHLHPPHYETMMNVRVSSSAHFLERTMTVMNYRLNGMISMRNSGKELLQRWQRTRQATTFFISKDLSQQFFLR